MNRKTSLRVYERMPVGWIIDRRMLTHFSIKSLFSFPALKIYLFLICSDSPTYDEIENYTFVARGEIKPALDLLEYKELITVRRCGNRNFYQINNSSRGTRFAKVPKRIFDDSLLQFLTLKRSTVQQNRRRQTALDALKLYCLFLAFRKNEDNRARIGYDKIIEYTSIQRKNIKRSISLLIEIGFINSENTYFVPRAGIFGAQYVPGHNTYFINYLEPYRPIEGWFFTPLDTRHHNEDPSE